jgi:hypothetical protein
MKNHALHYIAIACLFSLSGFAQRNDLTQNNPEIRNTQLMADNLASNDDVAVVSYRVEERINMIFGSSITTYEVSNAKLIGTNDLGENNTRVVTPKYAKIKPIAVAMVNVAQAAPIVNVITPPLEPIKVAVAAPEKVKSVNIDILRTYERVLEKGYKSEDMLRRVANGRYFDGNLDIAAKWYAQLFLITSNLEAVYYFRYAQALKAIGETEKSEEMMAIFEKNKNL